MGILEIEKFLFDVGLGIDRYYGPRPVIIARMVVVKIATWTLRNRKERNVREIPLYSLLFTIFIFNIKRRERDIKCES